MNLMNAFSGNRPPQGPFRVGGGPASGANYQSAAGFCGQDVAETGEIQTKLPSTSQYLFQPSSIPLPA